MTTQINKTPEAEDLTASIISLRTADEILNFVRALPGASFDLLYQPYNHSHRKAEALRAEAHRIDWQARCELAEQALGDWSEKEVSKALAAAL